ncbi:hypothetical protein GCM10009802_27710 [Streptomyces synnematoformans]|uniref:Uncharacterized protein n=1 Tax=Streptomyces synnematoformans TaxID=415721 RepID=A0ABN2Y8H2_9ACTN
MLRLSKVPTLGRAPYRERKHVGRPRHGSVNGNDTAAEGLAGAEATADRPCGSALRAPAQRAGQYVDGTG